MRHKARKIIEDINGTGGGPSKSLSLTNVEERAVALWGRVAVDGIRSATTIGLSTIHVPSDDAVGVDITPEPDQSITTPMPSTHFLKRKRGILLFLSLLFCIYTQL